MKRTIAIFLAAATLAASAFADLVPLKPHDDYWLARGYYREPGSTIWKPIAGARNTANLRKQK